MSRLLLNLCFLISLSSLAIGGGLLSKKKTPSQEQPQKEKSLDSITKMVELYRDESLALVEELQGVYGQKEFKDKFKSFEKFIEYHKTAPAIPPAKIKMIVGVFPGILKILVPLVRTNHQTRLKQLIVKGQKLEEQINAILSTRLVHYTKRITKKVNVSAPVTIVYFWANWCSPCLETLPILVNLRKKYSSKKLAIVTVNLDHKEQQKAIDKTQKKLNLNFPVIPSNFKELAPILIRLIPQTIIVKNNNLVEFTSNYDFSSNKMAKIIDESSN